jgi:hypothetical protein
MNLQWVVKWDYGDVCVCCVLWGGFRLDLLLIFRQGERGSKVATVSVLTFKTEGEREREESNETKSSKSNELLEVQTHTHTNTLN